MSKYSNKNILVNNSLINMLRDYFLDKKDVSTVYLFGSLVKGYNRASSDIDIAILFNKKLKSVIRFNLVIQYALDLESLVGKSVDVIDIKSIDPFFCS